MRAWVLKAVRLQTHQETGHDYGDDGESHVRNNGIRDVTSRVTAHLTEVGLTLAWNICEVVPYDWADEWPGCHSDMKESWWWSFKFNGRRRLLRPKRAKHHRAAGEGRRGFIGSGRRVSARANVPSCSTRAGKPL